MGAAILKVGGMTTALLGGAVALLQANSAVEGSLAAAAVAQAPADGGDFNENFGGADFGADPFGDLPEPAAPPAAATTAEPWPDAGSGFGDDLLDEPPAAAAPARRIDPLPDRLAEQPADAAGPVDFDFNSWTEPPPSAGAAPHPARPAPAAPPAAAVPRFDDDRPADAAVRLHLSKAAPPEAQQGEPFVYTITVRNDGAAPARGVRVEEPVPAGVQLEGTDPQAEIDGRTLSWALGDLPAGGERTVSVKVVPPAAGVVGSVTTVRCDLTASARTAVRAPRLSLEVRPVVAARAGRPFDLVLVAANDGTADAAGVAVRTLLPTGVRHASGERDLVYDVGPLRAGETRNVSLTVLADAPGPAEFRCELTGDAVPAAAQIAAVDVGRRQLTLTRSGPRTRFVGRTASYRTVVTNTSAEPAAPVRVVESVPPGLSFVSATEGGRYEDRTRQVVWEVPALPAGEARAVGLELRADAEGPAESVVVMESAGGVEAELVSATIVRGYTDVAPRVEGLNGPLAVGERVALVVTLHNTGTEPAEFVADLDLPTSVRVLGDRGDGFESFETARGIRIKPLAPLAADGRVVAEVLIEGAAAGGGAVELTVSADRLPEPVRQSEPIRVYADSE